MKLQIKDFDSLSNRELYEILRLRSEVFIVEQQGCYLDPDGIDCHSLHIFLWDEEKSSAEGCICICPHPDLPDTVQLGRLAVRSRRKGFGRILMEEAAKQAALRFQAKALFLDGRSSARGFYEALGYQASLPVCFSSEDEAFYFEFSRSI